MCYCARGMRGAAPWYHALARTLACASYQLLQYTSLAAFDSWNVLTLSHFRNEYYDKRSCLEC